MDSSTEPSRSYLVVINDPPGVGERSYNAMRLAIKLARRPRVRVRLFLLGEGVRCALGGADTSEDEARIERMVRSLARDGEVAT